MEAPFVENDLAAAEGCLAAGDVDAAQAMLERMVDEAEAYVAETCPPADDVQYFSFPAPVDRLAYRRVEGDPRRLVQVDLPLDRLYADLAFAYIRREDWEGAKGALAQAVRWNPMGCAYRLDLAELYRVTGDSREWAALSFSVLERARDARHVCRAYVNLGNLYLAEGNLGVAAGCAELARRYDAASDAAAALAEHVGQAADGAQLPQGDAAVAAVEAEGLPAGANAEVAVCLLRCASDAAREGDRAEATRLALAARDLVGEAAAKALMQLINESDAELAAERRDGGADAGEEAPRA